MAIKSRRLSIVLSPASASPSPEKPSLKRCSLAGSRSKSTQNSAAFQLNQQDQVLMDQLKVEGPHQIQQLRKHLNLLDSFNVLINLSQQTILAFNSTNPNHTSNHQDNRKINNRQELEDSFYHLILFRFELWLGRIADYLPKSLFEFNSNDHTDFVNLKNREDDYEIGLTLEYLPPLDVLFVWYCYCFNSRNYYEDSVRLYPILKHLRFPLDLAASEYDCSCPCTNYEKLKSKMKVENLAEADALLKAIKTSSSTESLIESPGHEDLKNPSLLSTLVLPKNFKTRAGSNSKNLWDNLTNTNFNIIDFINQPSFRTFVCPLCSDTIESPFYVRDPHSKLVQVSDSCWPCSSDPRSVSPDEKLDYEESQEKTPIDKKPAIATHKNHAKLKCQHCKWVGSKQDLSLFKFATELKFCLSNLSYTNNINNHSESTPIDCLAGTLTTSENLNNIQNAIFFNNLLLQDQNDAIFKHFDEQNPSDIKHRYQIEYSRYPAPFVKCDRRQNWLRKALAHIAPVPQSSSKAEHHNEVDSSQENNHNQMKSTQSQIRKTSTTEIHSKLDSREVAHNPRSSTGVIDHPVQKKPSDLNHKISMPIKPVQAWTDIEENKGVLSPVESLIEPKTTPDDILLLEHKAAQISVASYFENIYTTNDSPVKSGTISLQLTPSKQRNQSPSTHLDETDEKQQPQKGKQVAEDILESGSSSVDTLYSPSSCSTSTPVLENEIGSSSNSETAKPDAGVIYEAKKISIKFADDAKNLVSPLSKVLSVIEPYSVKKNGFNAPITSNPLPQTTIPPIRIVRLDSSISQHQTDQGMINRPLIQGDIKIKSQVDGNGTQNSAQKCDKNHNWLKSIQDSAGSGVINHQFKHIQDQAKSSTIYYLPPKSDQLNHKEEHKSKYVDPTQNRLDTERNKKPFRDSAPTVKFENRQKPRIANSNIPILLVTPERNNNNSSATFSAPSHPLYNLDSSSPNQSFFEIPIGKIAFVEEGNKLRCL